jgi:hypothetical protein
MLNQLIVFDELVAGRVPRWAESEETTLRNIDTLLAEAMTPRQQCAG